MRAGVLRLRVALATPVNLPDGDGGFTQAWASLSPSPVWASVAPATASVMERLVAATTQSSATHVVELRYHAGVTTQTRVTLGSRHLYVRGVQHVDERREMTRLICEEVVA